MNQPFKKRNGLSKLLLRLDKARFKRYKSESYIDAISQKLQRFAAEALPDPASIRALAMKNGFLNVSHAGNAGDVIYALPTVRALQELTGVPLNLFLKLGEPMTMLPHFNHPLGTVMLNEQMASLLLPLLRGQPYIAACSILENEPVHLELDAFRRSGLSLDRGNITRWYDHVTGVRSDAAKQWLDLVPNPAFKDTILIARSTRYRNPALDYSFLSAYPNVAFVGVTDELDDFKRYVPQIQRVEATDFADLAAIIAGCKLFIGNQSFPYALAEGLKTPRLLEVALDVPNVIPEGGRCFGFYFQQHLEHYVTEWAGKP